MSERLNKLYRAMETLQKEGVPFNSVQERQLNDLEEEIIKKEILPIVTKSIEPVLHQVQRGLVLVVDYIPGNPISVHLSRTRNFIKGIEDVVEIVPDPAVEHKVQGRQQKTPISKSPKTRLRITFADGHVLYSPKAVDTFTSFIREVGVERVRALGLRQNKVPLISNTLDSKYQSSQRDMGNGWYLITHSSTRDKQRDVRKIAAALHIACTVEIE